jgi:hypothetical protein
MAADEAKAQALSVRTVARKFTIDLVHTLEEQFPKHKQVEEFGNIMRCGIEVYATAKWYLHPKPADAVCEGDVHAAFICDKGCAHDACVAGQSATTYWVLLYSNEKYYLVQQSNKIDAPLVEQK